MGAALARRENGVVHALLEVLGLVRVTLKEDETSTGAAEGLVRRGRDNVAVLEGVRELTSSDKAAGVCNVRHEVRAMLVRDSTQRLVVPVARVRGRTADEQTRLVDLCELGHALVVDQLRLGVERVGKRLEVDRRRRHLFLSGLDNILVSGYRCSAGGAHT